MKSSDVICRSAPARTIAEEAAKPAAGPAEVVDDGVARRQTGVDAGPAALAEAQTRSRISVTYRLPLPAG
jgi:hypothetical protein